MCHHTRLPEPTFDKDLCDRGGLDVETIRRMFPRVIEVCPDCNQRIIMYASKAHIVYGDW